AFNFFFFFSSRRRHTRLQGDWSSDVCSSDLFERRGLDLRARRRALDTGHRFLDDEIDRLRQLDSYRFRVVELDPDEHVGNQVIRSEEHTSELQSPCNLVCRLLLEKKKKKKT